VLQDEGEATTSPRLTPDSARIVFEDMTAMEICDLIRMHVSSDAGAFIELRGGGLHFWEFVPFEQIDFLRRAYRNRAR